MSRPWSDPTNTPAVRALYGMAPELAEAVLAWSDRHKGIAVRYQNQSEQSLHHLTDKLRSLIREHGGEARTSTSAAVGTVGGVPMSYEQRSDVQHRQANIEEALRRIKAAERMSRGLSATVADAIRYELAAARAALEGKA